MSKQFEEDFYTDDFDQEMVDYLYNNGWIVCGNTSDNKPSLAQPYLKYGLNNKYFWTSEQETSYYIKLTKQEFKEKIGMATKQFTKSDLLDGMKVKYRSGYERIVFASSLYELIDNDLVHQLDLTEYRDDLTAYGSSNSWDIMQVTDRDGAVLFTRQEEPAKSPAQIELDKLHEQIAALQEQANKLQGAIG